MAKKSGKKEYVDKSTNTLPPRSFGGSNLYLLLTSFMVKLRDFLYVMNNGQISIYVNFVLIF